MNTIVTSREDILHSSRELIRRQGWEAVNIRSVAAGLRGVGGVDLQLFQLQGGAGRRHGGKHLARDLPLPAGAHGVCRYPGLCFLAV